MGYSQIQNRMLEILEPAQKGDTASRVCDTLIALLVVFNILAVTFESVSDLSVKYADHFYTFEFFSVIIFSIEYLMRLWASAAKHANEDKIFGSARLGYMFSFSGLIDLVSILPFYLQALFPGIGPARSANATAFAYFQAFKLQHSHRGSIQCCL